MLGIPDTDAATYTTKIHNNRVTELLLPDLNKQFLTDLGITVIGDILTILQHATQSPSSATSHSSFLKPAMAKAPEIAADMTCPQFRKFKVDWDVYKNITGISTAQIPSQLYSLCADSVQSTIINTKSDLFTIPEPDLLNTMQPSSLKNLTPAYIG